VRGKGNVPDRRKRLDHEGGLIGFGEGRKKVVKREESKKVWGG